MYETPASTKPLQRIPKAEAKAEAKTKAKAALSFVANLARTRLTNVLLIATAGLAALGLPYAANANTEVIITWVGEVQDNGEFSGPGNFNNEPIGGTISFTLIPQPASGRNDSRAYSTCSGPTCGDLTAEWLDTFTVNNSEGPGLDFDLGRVDLRLKDGADGAELFLELGESGASTQTTFTQSIQFVLRGPSNSLLADTGDIPGFLSAADLLFENLVLDRFDEAMGLIRTSTRTSFSFNITTFSIDVIRDTPPAPRIPPLVGSPAELVSTNNSGTGANGISWDPALSADGLWLAFSSDATDLTADPNGALRDIFLQNRVTGELLNVTAGGDGESRDPVLSKNGRWLAFVTRATNLATDVPDTNGATDDIVLMEIATGALTLVTADANAGSSRPSLSRDGQQLVFDTLATNLGESNYQPEGCAPAPSTDQPACFSNVVLYSQATTSRLILTQGASSDAFNSTISEDGIQVAFVSQAFDGSTTPDLVVMNLDTGERLSSKEGSDFSQSRPVISATGRWVAIENTVGAGQLILFDTSRADESFNAGASIWFHSTLSTDHDLPGEFSSDESTLVFSSTTANQLLPDPNGSGRDIYSLQPFPCCPIERVTVAGLGPSGGPVTNADGTLVAFDSTANNFANDDNGSLSDVFLIGSTEVTAQQPTAGNQALSVVAGESLEITLTGLSPAGDPLQFEITQDPSQGTLQGIPPDLIYTPLAGFSGEDLFRFQVSASGIASAPAEITITVEPASEPPPTGGGELDAPVAAVLPSSRSVLLGDTATAFATLINTNSEPLEGCSVTTPAGISADFFYQTTDPSTNELVGEPNTAASVPGGAIQTFLFGLTPTSASAPTEIALNFDCTNSPPANAIEGVNTLLLSSSESPVPDIVVLGATPTNDGILNMPGTNGSAAFAVASVNVGSAATVVVRPDTGLADLPLTLTICETNPDNGQCLSTPSAMVESSIAAGAVPTFSIFATATGDVTFDPTSTRIRVRFLEAGVVRGSTSVAVRTQ